MTGEGMIRTIESIKKQREAWMKKKWIQLGRDWVDN